MNRICILLAAAGMLACGQGGGDQAALVADSTARDLTRAGMDSTAQPELKDVPETTTRPSTPAPTSTKAPPPPPAKQTPESPAPKETNPPASAPGSSARSGVIAAGTSLSLASASKVCTNTSKVGDRFKAYLTASVDGTNGVSLPDSSVVELELTELKGSNGKGEQIVMGFRVVSITAGAQTYTPDAEVVSAQIDQVAAQSGGDAAKKVAGGAAAGAIVGQILGRNRKGTLIGAAVGAAAGAAAAKAGGDDFDGCVNAGAPISVKLNSSLTVSR